MSVDIRIPRRDHRIRTDDERRPYRELARYRRRKPPKSRSTQEKSR